MTLEIISFLTISLLIAITPGPSVIYVVSYSLRYGTKAGIVSTLGINAGSIVSILIAAFGLSSILETYPSAISVIEIVGGIYVIYLATLLWPRRETTTVDEPILVEESYQNLFKNGVITSVLNPKDIVFYIAFIPTFIPQSIDESSYKGYFLLLAFSYMAIGFMTKSAFALFAGFTKNALRSDSANIVNYLSSTLLFSLGVFLLGKSLNLFSRT